MTTVKLSGPGTEDLMGKIGKLMDAATDACTAYAASTVKKMQADDLHLQQLHRNKQRLESEVKALETKKKNLQAQAQQVQQPKQQMKKDTKPLTPEAQAALMVKQEEEREARKKKAEEERHKPLTHSPFASLSIQIGEDPPQEEQAQS